MIIGVGIDLQEIDRLGEAYDRSGDRFLSRVFTKRELADAEAQGKARARFLAGRFAAKEALFKALGTGVSGGITWQDAEVTNLPNGKPEIAIQGKSRDLFEGLRGRHIWLSITHSALSAAAVVVLEA